MTEKEVSQQDFPSHTRKEEEVVIFYLVEHGQVSSGQFKLSRDIFLGPVIHERQTDRQTKKKAASFFFFYFVVPYKRPFWRGWKTGKWPLGMNELGRDIN